MLRTPPTFLPTIQPGEAFSAVIDGEPTDVEMIGPTFGDAPEGYAVCVLDTDEVRFITEGDVEIPVGERVYVQLTDTGWYRGEVEGFDPVTGLFRVRTLEELDEYDRIVTPEIVVDLPREAVAISTFDY